MTNRHGRHFMQEVEAGRLGVTGGDEEKVALVYTVQTFNQRGRARRVFPTPRLILFGISGVFIGGVDCHLGVYF